MFVSKHLQKDEIVPSRNVCKDRLGFRLLQAWNGTFLLLPSCKSPLHTPQKQWLINHTYSCKLISQVEKGLSLHFFPRLNLEPSVCNVCSFGGKLWLLPLATTLDELAKSACHWNPLDPQNFEKLFQNHFKIAWAALQPSLAINCKICTRNGLICICSGMQT